MKSGIALTVLLACAAAAAAFSQSPAAPAAADAPAAAAAPTPEQPDAVRTLVSRLDLERYKATIKGLTQFGDRRQGTERNRKAVDWIEAQLKSYGCPTERIKYRRTRRRRRSRRRRPAGGAAGDPNARAVGGGRPRGTARGTGVNTDPHAPARREAARAEQRAVHAGPARGGLLHQGRHHASRRDVHHRRAHGRARLGRGGQRRRLGHGAGDGAGARFSAMPDVQTERTIRFALWNNEETGLNGARAYVEQRRGLQGRGDPPGSGRYPEPKWLGMIQHDMMMFDHGMPRADGTISPDPAARGRRQHRVPVQLADGGRVAEAGLVLPRRQRGVRHRLSRRRSART